MEYQEIAVMEDQQYSPQQITLDDSLFNKCHRLAQIMTSGTCTIPEHLQRKRDNNGNIVLDRTGDCFAIVGQALRWGMDPYAVAQKTHLVKGVLGYEAQLVIAVINNRAPITDRLSFEYFGEWDKVKGKNDKSQAGVIVRATFKGNDAPTELSLTMAQVGDVRNSPLWEADPRQQLAYLAAKRFSRLHCPDVILGVYTPDELADRGNEAPRNVTPKAQNAGASALLNRVKPKQPTAEAPVIEYYDTSELLSTIEQITDVKQIKPIGEEIAAMVNNVAINIRDEDVNDLRQALADQKQSIILADEYDNIMKHVKAAETLEDVERMRGLIEDKKQDFDEGDIKMLNDTLDVVAEDIGAQG